MHAWILSPSRQKFVLFSPLNSLPLLLFSSVDPAVVLVKPARALHQLHLGALGADDVVAVGDEATSDQRGLAARADEAIIMPVPILERDEASAANA